MTYFSNAAIETYIPNPLVWTDTGISCSTYFGKESPVIRVGYYLYSFGGNTGSNHDKVWVAPWNDSLNWIDWGGTLPAAASGLRIMVIDGYIYAFGDQHKGVYIWRSHVSNPLVWKDTGATLPASGGARYNAPYAVVGNKICIFQGDTDGVSPTTILTADVSDPLTWSKVVVSGAPAFFTESSVAVIDDKAYLYGGYDSSGYAIFEYRTDLTVMDKFDPRLQ